MNTWRDVLARSPDAAMGVRPEFIEEFARGLRVAIGNLPDATPGHIILVESIRKVFANRVNLLGLYDIAQEIMLQLGRASNSADRRIRRARMVEWLISKYRISGRAGQGIVLAFLEMEDRTIRMDCAREGWDGVLALSRLFEAEHLPDDTEQYLDQRFIDCLAAQGEEIERMHWRNCERPVAEFFKRRSYVVSLGPGTKDGGVDVRIWPAGKRSRGPPLLVVQSKRYKKGTLVGIEWKKALWADVSVEGAEGGLLATTDRVSPEGKRLAEARRLPLKFGENERVRRWVRSMWRHAYRPKLRTTGVGVYYLPPLHVLHPSARGEDVMPTRAAQEKE